MRLKPCFRFLLVFFFPLVTLGQNAVDTMSSDIYLSGPINAPYYLIRSSDRVPRFGLNLLGVRELGNVYLDTDNEEVFTNEKRTDGLVSEVDGSEILSTRSTGIYPRRFYDSGHKILFLPRYVSYASLSRTSAGFLSLYSDTFSLNLQNTHISRFKIFRVWDFKNFMRKLTLSQSKINSLSIEGITISGDRNNNLTIEQSEVDSFRMKDVTLLGSISLGDNLPDMIELSGIDFRNAGSVIDFTHLKASEGRVCELYLHDLGENIDHLKLNYESFHLGFDPAVSMWERDRIYRQLLTRQQQDGFTYGFEKIDKEYKRFKYNRNGLYGSIQNIIDEWWWNYGYDKFKVISNSIEIFLVFLVLNLFIYKRLTKIYYPDKFRAYDARLEWRKENDPDNRRSAVFFYQAGRVIIYTAYVFWGVKLDLKELELRRPVFFFILIFEYVAGLICIGYIANYIITK